MLKQSIIDSERIGKPISLPSSNNPTWARKMDKKEGWWHQFFREFRPVFGMIPPKTTHAEARWIIKKLKLKPGQSFLDCPCGIGRIAIPLAKRGVKVTGVDIVPSYLREFKRKADHLGLRIRLLESDMRRIDFVDQFDTAGNLWTSFGFFEKESDNLLVLRKIFKALKPGGRFLLQVINRDWIMANYNDADWFEIEDLKVLENRKFDYTTSINKTVWTFLKKGREASHQISIRMYSYHELIAMFKKVGFADIRGYGSLKDEPISRKSRMMFIIGIKPRKSK
jgi:ubiquinone/menaquinone biosynthesis C-methylase UbiE